MQTKDNKRFQDTFQLGNLVLRRWNNGGWRELYGLGIVREINLSHPFLDGNYWVKVFWTNEEKNKYDFCYHPGDLILAEEVLTTEEKTKKEVL